jgi:hypothetical protein
VVHTSHLHTQIHQDIHIKETQKPKPTSQVVYARVGKVVRGSWKLSEMGRGAVGGIWDLGVVGGDGWGWRMEGVMKSDR